MNIWLHGGPKNAEYWGLELTTAGRELAKNIVVKHQIV